MVPSSTSRKAREIFEDAIEYDSTDARAGFVAQACGGDAELRLRVESLIRANDNAESMLPDEPPPAFAPIPAEQPGDRVGRYKLLEKIGEGGCGVVYMAEQEEPVRRRVALKLIKPGMDSQSVIARFEAERQALAMMDHPNIARVFDAGTTGQQSGMEPLSSEVRPLSSDAGRPYFVMELVRGVRLTEYCRNQALTIRDRLNLFIAVCSAVQHAHQKGIIHRDLKPSNILVTEIDGKAVPKVIDFGIARATEQKLTDKTLLTHFAQFAGTPAYMSPEQAAMSGADIDTRSDIYSLGVLLYELLTGTTPFDSKELLSAGFDEMRRIIREAEPARPSTRLTQPHAGSGIEPRESKSDIYNSRSKIGTDLDWIVMKCLEKDRARRYETASGLAADIQRHLSSEPVTARPVSAAYRLRKMVRRNSLAFGAAAAVAAALVAGLVISTWQAIRATRAEYEQNRLRTEAQRNAIVAKTEAQKSKQVAQFLKDMLEGVAPSVALGEDKTMLRKIVDTTAERIGTQLTGQPEVEAELRTLMGKIYDALGAYDNASAMLDKALTITKTFRGDQHKEVVYLLNAHAQVLRQQGKLADAEAMLREALAMERKIVGEDGDVSTSLNNLGLVLESRGLYAEAEQIHRKALAMTRTFAGTEHKDVATSLNNLAVVLQMQQKFDEAETTLREALEIEKRQFGHEHPDVAITLNNLANVVQLQNKFEASESLFREVLAMQRKLLGNAHPNVATALNGLALALHHQGRNGQAAPLLREAVEIEKRTRSAAHPQTARLVGNLGRILQGLRKYDEAESQFREALGIYQQLPGGEHPDVVTWRNRLGNLLKGKNSWPELEIVMRDILASARRTAPGDESSASVAEALINVAYALRMQAKFPEAETMLLEGYNLLTQKPAEHQDLEREALSGLVRLYEAWSKPEQASAWRKKLTELQESNTQPEAEPKIESSKQ